MRSLARLVRRGTGYYFRMRAPADLRGHFGGKRETVESLRLHGADKEARGCRAGGLKSVAMDRRFAELRRQRAEGPLRQITDEAIEHNVAKPRPPAWALMKRRMADLADDVIFNHTKSG